MTGSSEHGRAGLGPARYPICKCGARGLLDERYDSYYCPTSNVWLEKSCSDDCDTGHCTERPDTRPTNEIETEEQWDERLAKSAAEFRK